MVRRPMPPTEAQAEWKEGRLELNAIQVHLGIVEAGSSDAEHRRHDHNEHVQQCLLQRLKLYYWIKTATDFGVSPPTRAVDAVVASTTVMSPECIVLEAIVEEKATAYHRYIMELRHSHL